MANSKHGLLRIEESNDAQEIMIPDQSCKGCRDEYNIYNKQHRLTINNLMIQVNRQTNQLSKLMMELSIMSYIY